VPAAASARRRCPPRPRSAQNQGRHAPAQGRPAAQGQAPATSPHPPRADLPAGSWRVWCRERERSHSSHGRGKRNTLACQGFPRACRLKVPGRSRGAAPRSKALQPWSCRSRFPPRWRSCLDQETQRIRRAASPAPAHRKNARPPAPAARRRAVPRPMRAPAPPAASASFAPR